MIKETEEHEKFENSTTAKSIFHRDINNMSELSQARVKDTAKIPDTLESGNFALIGIKKFKPFSQLVKAKIEEQFLYLKDDPRAHYFAEI